MFETTKDPEKKKAGRGGARPGGGRKKVEGERHTYTVPADVDRWIKEHGEGAYITRIIRSLMEQQDPS